MKKSFMYVAAIALLTAGTAFAQSASPGANGSTINNSTPTPAAKGAAEGAPRASDQSGTMMNQSGSMNKSGDASNMGSSSSMNQSSDMNQSAGASKSSSNKSKARVHHVASNRMRGSDSKENQETMQLNRQQLAGDSNMGGMNGMSSSGGNSFDSGSPQQAQAGGANCTPDNMSCGTARQNPAINSSPQQRTYGTQQQ
ncbi:MAG TPA: hypothetical protein VGF92_18460 [Stellaceae bacterium]|jgi:hypothetical protein